jgi:phosphomannomutase
LSDQSPLAPPGIFKAYDIRGLYGSEMDETTAEAIGRAFARVCAASGQASSGLGWDVTCD